MNHRPGSRRLLPLLAAVARSPAWTLPVAGALDRVHLRCEYRVDPPGIIDGAGFQQIIIRPNPPAPSSNPENAPIAWVKAEYGSIRGKIFSEWRRDGGRFELDVTTPANTTAAVFLPASGQESITEGGRRLDGTAGVQFLRQEGDRAVLGVLSGRYRFASSL